MNEAPAPDIDAGVQAIRSVLRAEYDNVSRLETVNRDLGADFGLTAGNAGHSNPVLSKRLVDKAGTIKSAAGRGSAQAVRFAQLRGGCSDNVHPHAGR